MTDRRLDGDRRRPVGCTGVGDRESRRRPAQAGRCLPSRCWPGSRSSAWPSASRSWSPRALRTTLRQARCSWLALGGVANIAGLSFLYVAYRVGDVGLVAPITSTEGAIAAVIAIAAGQRVHVIVLILLAVIVLGVVRAADGRTRQVAMAGRFNWGVVTVACLGAICFGVGLYATGRASAHEQIGWIAASPRIVGVICVALPLVRDRAPADNTGRRSGPAAVSVLRGRGLHPLLRSSAPIGRGRRGAGITVRRVCRDRRGRSCSESG